MVATAVLIPRLHQDTCRPDTCILTSNLYPDVDGYKLLVRDTCWLYLGDIITTFIYVTVDLYPFVSSNRRATNWRQFCRRYMTTATSGHTWIQLVSGDMYPGVNAALEAGGKTSGWLAQVSGWSWLAPWSYYVLSVAAWLQCVNRYDKRRQSQTDEKSDFVHV